MRISSPAKNAYAPTFAGLAACVARHRRGRRRARRGAPLILAGAGDPGRKVAAARQEGARGLIRSIGWAVRSREPATWQQRSHGERRQGKGAGRRGPCARGVRVGGAHLMLPGEAGVRWKTRGLSSMAAASPPAGCALGKGRAHVRGQRCERRAVGASRYHQGPGPAPSAARLCRRCHQEPSRVRSAHLPGWRENVNVPASPGVCISIGVPATRPPCSPKGDPNPS
jgi:hypothetical protein